MTQSQLLISDIQSPTIEFHPSLDLRPILPLVRDGLSEAAEDGAQVHATLSGITAEEIDCKQNRIVTSM